jgi:integrase
MHNGKLTPKNFYEPWLKDGLTLAAETGLRREELSELRFCDIIEEGAQKPYLKVKNIKVNRIKDLEDPEEWEYLPIPISSGSIELLKKLGIEEHKGSSRYILAPEKKNRNAIMDILTRAFTHFYKLVNPNGNLNFKNLRKTNLTYKRVMDRYNTTHSNDRVLKEHYEDRVIIARNLFGYKLFPDDVDGAENINHWA